MAPVVCRLICGRFPLKLSIDLVVALLVPMRLDGRSIKKGFYLFRREKK